MTGLLLRPIFRRLLLAAGLTVVLTFGVPAGAFAAVQKPTYVPEKTATYRIGVHPCATDASKTCYAIATYRESAHWVTAKSSLASRMAGVAAACGNYNVNQWWFIQDWGYWGGGFVEMDEVSLNAGAGYDGCGNSWTNWVTPNCSTYVPGIECVGYTGSCGSTSCGGNYHDPSHSNWNTEWYNQYIKEWCGPYVCTSWTAYIRLWNDGYGNTDHWSGE